MMEQELRTERTFGVTSTLKPAQRMRLLAFLNSEVYPDVLDVMEMVCIELESKLINTEAEQEAAVLANHKMTKAAWQIFVHIQQKIADESALYLRSVEKKPPVPALTEQERYIENLLNPTRPSPEEAEFTGA